MTADIAPLIRALERRDRLPDEEREVLVRGPWRTRSYGPEEQIVAEGDKPHECCLVIEGIAGRTKTFSDGRRQITALQLPGDFVDLHGLLLRIMDHNVAALTPVKAAFIQHDLIRGMTETSPHLARQLWNLTMIDGAIQRNFIASLGRRPADAHLAHLVCEMYLRFEVVGLARDLSFDLPLSQGVLADVLGLSVVHVNRMIQQLRGERLLVWQRQTVSIPDWDRLVDYAEFDPTYLNLFTAPR